MPRHRGTPLNTIRKWRKIQEQFSIRSKKRYEGKRVMIADVITELCEEWCMSESRIRTILRKKIDKK